MMYASFPGRMVMVGFGSIGQGVLPLLLRHLRIAPSQITIVTAEPRGRDEAAALGANFAITPLTRENFARILDPLLGQGDFLLNVSIEVSSLALVEFCRRKGALYLDSCVEPWPGGYTDPSLTPSQRSNYALRESALKLRAGAAGAPTAVVTHGANPGLVSHFVKAALLDVAAATGVAAAAPMSRSGWAGLAQRLGVKVIHIAERDTQVSPRPKRRGEFVNTWSIDGFVGEGAQPAELGWGSHERHFPPDGACHDFGCGAAIYLNRPGAATRVRSWTRSRGPITASSSPITRRSRSPTISPSPKAANCVTARPRIMPITRATPRCCRCTNLPARTGGFSRSNGSSWRRSNPAWTSSAYC